MVEELDTKIKSLTDKMYEEGIDTKTVAKIVEDKEAAEARSAKLYQEVSGSGIRDSCADGMDEG